MRKGESGGVGSITLRLTRAIMLTGQLISSLVRFLQVFRLYHYNYEVIISMMFLSDYFRQGKCRLSLPGQQCEVGLRRKTYHVLSGSVLGVWSHIEGVFNRHSTHSHRIQIVRVRTESKRFVGKFFFPSCSGYGMTVISSVCC